MLLYEMLAGKSPFDIGGHDMPDQSTEDYLFQGMHRQVLEILRMLSDSTYLQMRANKCGALHNFFNLSIYLYIFPVVILEKTIRIPRSLSVKAAGVLKGFLNKVIITDP